MLLGNEVKAFPTVLRQGSYVAGLVFSAMIPKIKHRLTASGQARGIAFHLIPLLGDPGATTRWKQHFVDYDIDDLNLPVLGLGDDLFLHAHPT